MSNPNDTGVVSPKAKTASKPKAVKAADLKPGTRIIDPLSGRDVLAVEAKQTRKFPHGDRVFIEARNERTHIKTTRTLGVAQGVEVAQ